MRRGILLLVLILFFAACDQPVGKIRGVPPVGKVKQAIPDLNQQAADLKEKGYQIFAYQEGDTTYLMQQYFMVFLKEGNIRNQDSTEAAKIQKQHLAHLNRMAEEGYVSLAGPFSGSGEIKGIVVYNTASLQEADSLANLDPAVKAGRLQVEVHPWWAAKGGKLK